MKIKRFLSIYICGALIVAAGSCKNNAEKEEGQEEQKPIEAPSALNGLSDRERMLLESYLDESDIDSLKEANAMFADVDMFGNPITGEQLQIEDVMATEIEEAPATDVTESPTQRNNSVSVAEASNQDDKVVFTTTGIGPIRLGMSKMDIPSSVPGFYTTTRYTAYNHNLDTDIPSDLEGCVSLYNGSEYVGTATVSNAGKVVAINVDSKKYPSTNGIVTGMPLSKVIALPAARPVDNVTVDAVEAGGFTFYHDTKQVTGVAIGYVY